MFGFGGCVPVDKESAKVIAAMQYLHLREEQEVEKVKATYKTPTGSLTKEESDRVQQRNDNMQKVRDEFKKKEIALLRRVAGPLAKIIDG